MIMGCTGSAPELTLISIIFLDVDGVLNSVDSDIIDKVHLDNLEYIINHSKFPCKIVLSTSWRKHENTKIELLDTLKSELNVDDIDNLVIGSTPLLEKSQRAIEIDRYFKLNRDVLNKKYKTESWVALDDMSLDKPNEECKQIMNGHFVKINCQYGLTLDQAKVALNILNGNESANDQYNQQLNQKEAEIEANVQALYTKYS